MRRIALLVVLTLSLPGCVESGDEIDARAGAVVSAKATAAISECKQKYSSGVFHTKTEQITCENAGIESAYAASGYKFMDLLRIHLANASVLAEKMDRHELSDAEGQLFMAKSESQWHEREMQRVAEKNQENAPMRAAILQQLLSRQTQFVPQTPYMIPINPKPAFTCSTMNGISNCVGY